MRVFQLNRLSYWSGRRCGRLVKSYEFSKSSRPGKKSWNEGAADDIVVKTSPVGV